jgi:RNA polymerase sigma factor (sigma-70 family)
MAVKLMERLLNRTGTEPMRKSKPAIVPESEAGVDLNLLDDEALVKRAQRREPAAFDVLVRRYQERLYATVYQMTSNHEDANDLLQNIFVKAYRSLGQFKGQSSFYTWLYRIAVNRTLNFIKRRKDKNHFSLNDVDTSIESDPDFVELMSHTTPRTEAGLNELQNTLNEAIQKLSESHRAVVIMHDVQGMTHTDIARVMRCSEGTVRSRLFYARQHLQELLAKYI